jgi:hypothetical protein
VIVHGAEERDASALDERRLEGPFLFIIHFRSIEIFQALR